VSGRTSDSTCHCPPRTARGRVLEQDSASFLSTGEIAEQVTTVDDLNRRLELYSNQLFQQAYWEAGLFKAEILSDLKMTQILPLAEQAVIPPKALSP
jgi:hypothetical protein